MAGTLDDSLMEDEEIPTYVCDNPLFEIVPLDPFSIIILSLSCLIVSSPVQGAGCRVQGVGCRVSVVGVRVSGVGFAGFRV